MFPTHTDLRLNPRQTADDSDSDGSVNKPRGKPSYFLEHPAAFSISPLGSDNSNYGWHRWVTVKSESIDDDVLQWLATLMKVRSQHSLHIAAVLVTLLTAAAGPKLISTCPCNPPHPHPPQNNLNHRLFGNKVVWSRRSHGAATDGRKVNTAASVAPSTMRRKMRQRDPEQSEKRAFNEMEWFTGTRFPLQCANCFHTISWQLSNEGYLSRRCSSSPALLSAEGGSGTSSSMPFAASGVCVGLGWGWGSARGGGGGEPQQDAVTPNTPLLRHQHHLLKRQRTLILPFCFF